MEKILYARAPMPPPSSFSLSSSSPINQRPGQLGFRFNRSPSLLFKQIRVSMSSSEGVATAIEMQPMNAEEFVDLESLSVMALSPLDGRYLLDVKELCPFFSEYGLIRYRVMIEVKWLLKLSEITEFKEVPTFSKNAQSYLESIISNFNKDDALEVKFFEKVTSHDVMAVEYFLKEKCKSNPEIAEVLDFFGFACASEDINTLAYALALKEAFNTVVFPVMIELLNAIRKLAKENANIFMLSRTHGQPASPIALGMEMANFGFRLSNVGKKFTEIQIFGKCGDGVAAKVVCPKINWLNAAEEFVNFLGICYSPFATQMVRENNIYSFSSRVSQFNMILADFDQDIWSYISVGYFKQMTKAGEIGSSTSSDEANHIDFENSMCNLCVAFAVLQTEIPIPQMLRGWTDSTNLKNLGVGSGYSLLAYKSTLQGIRKLQVNESCLVDKPEHMWEVPAEQQHCSLFFIK